VSIRIHGASSTQPMVLTAAEAGELLGGEWDDEDATPLCVLVDWGNGEAWEVGGSVEEVRDLAAALALAAEQMERRTGGSGCRA
jgi:hypothetical protein